MASVPAYVLAALMPSSENIIIPTKSKEEVKIMDLRARISDISTLGLVTVEFN